MENKVYISQFNVGTNNGRKRLSKLKSALSNVGVFLYEVPGNTTSYRAVYVDKENSKKASETWGKIIAEENKKFYPNFAK